MSHKKPAEISKKMDKKVLSKEPLPPLNRGITEEELVKLKPNITPEDILKLNKFTNSKIFHFV